MTNLLYARLKVTRKFQ